MKLKIIIAALRAGQELPHSTGVKWAGLAVTGVSLALTALSGVAFSQGWIQADIPPEQIYEFSSLLVTIVLGLLGFVQVATTPRVGLAASPIVHDPPAGRPRRAAARRAGRPTLTLNPNPLFSRATHLLNGSASRSSMDLSISDLAELQRPWCPLPILLSSSHRENLDQHHRLVPQTQDRPGYLDSAGGTDRASRDACRSGAEAHMGAGAPERAAAGAGSRGAERDGDLEDQFRAGGAGGAASAREDGGDA
ncbi:MAG: hypothetical protein MZV65_32050 [Chromatiales bacterium]|nr:hypothetical protein [Chromatiales bacterium]